MKKKLFFIVLLLTTMYCFAHEKKTIAVIKPKTKNINMEDETVNWIPDYIQGIISTNFTNYSGMIVIDRQNEDVAKAEQRMSENESYSTDIIIEAGKILNAQLLVIGNIIQKSTSFSISLNITDSETNQSKASVNIESCSFSEIESGEIISKLSYDLMKSYGIQLSKEAESKLNPRTKVKDKDMSLMAQKEIAKGLQAAKKNASLEAQTYYFNARIMDNSLPEAALLTKNMTTTISTGNFGADAKNLIKLRNDWDTLLGTITDFLLNHEPIYTLVYDTNIKPGKINYDRNTVELIMNYPVLYVQIQEECTKLIEEYRTALSKIPESKEWGDRINDFPFSYAKSKNTNNWLLLLDENNYRNTLEFNFSYNVKNDLNQKLIETQLNYRFQKNSNFNHISKNFYSVRADEKYTKFSDEVSVDKSDSQSYSVSINQIGNQNVSIMSREHFAPYEKKIEKQNSRLKQKYGNLSIGAKVDMFSNNIEPTIKDESSSFSNSNICVDLDVDLSITKTLYLSMNANLCDNSKTESEIKPYYIGGGCGIGLDFYKNLYSSIKVECGGQYLSFNNYNIYNENSLVIPFKTFGMYGAYASVQLYLYFLYAEYKLSYYFTDEPKYNLGNIMSNSISIGVSIPIPTI